MLVIIGLAILSISVLLASMGFAVNSHRPFTGDFSILGQHLTGLTTGGLFLFGVIIGLAIALGLSILRGIFSRRFASRGLQRDLKKSLAETAALRVEYERLSERLISEQATNRSNLASQAVEIPAVSPNGDVS